MRAMREGPYIASSRETSGLRSVVQLLIDCAAFSPLSSLNFGSSIIVIAACHSSKRQGEAQALLLLDQIAASTAGFGTREPEAEARSKQTCAKSAGIRLGFGSEGVIFCDQPRWNLAPQPDPIGIGLDFKR